MLSDTAVAQLRWLIAALRSDDHDPSLADAADLALRLEHALAGAPGDLRTRLREAVSLRDAALLVGLACWHETEAYPAPTPEERTAHRGRARRYREIAQIFGVL